MHLLLSLKRTFAKQEQHAKHALIFEKTSPFLHVSLKVKHNEIPKYFYLFLGALVGVTLPHTKLYKGHFLYPFVVAQPRDPTPKEA
jgi:hypothetical protein